MNIFNYEFKRLLKQTFFWTFGISAMIILSMVIFSEFMEEGLMKDLTPMLEGPLLSNMMQAFGIDPAQLSNILGFYVTRNSAFTMLMGSIFAIMASSSIIAREESDKTAEFLLTRPVTRIRIMSEKLLAFHTHLFLLNLIVSVIGFTCLEIFKTSSYDLTAFLIICFYTYLLMLLFSSFGLLYSVLASRGRVFWGVLIGIVIGTYFLEIFSNITESFQFIGYFSPFTYVDTGVLAPDYRLEFLRVLFFAGIALILTAFSFRIYRRKDIV